jgi:beta-xylosidase
MMIYNEDRSGNPYLTFTYIDDVMDFLLSIHLKPLIQFSFMPKLLAKEPSRTIFHNASILSEPKDYNKWAYLITGLTRHFIERYGLTEVRTWFFTFWSIPYKPYIFSFENNQTAYELYQITRACVKKCDENLQFGNPSYTSADFGSNELQYFLDFCIQNECYPDFYNIHCYPVQKMEESDLANIVALDNPDMEQLVLSDDPDYLFNAIKTFKKDISNYPDLPIYITEWASTTSHRDWLNDTCYRSSYIIYNILKNYDAVNSFSNWCLSDTLEELPLENEVFHGELGLFTTNCIKKPAYYAYQFLSKLLDILIASGDGYFITSDQKGNYSIILYNYIPLSPIYAQGMLFNVTFLERYNAFVNPNSKVISLLLSHMENGNYNLKEQYVNRDSGSAFDEWVRMGAQPFTTEEDVNILKGRSMPMILKQQIPVTNHTLYYSAELKPHEIKLVTISKQL